MVARPDLKMSFAAQLALYCAVIVAGALAGATVPLWLGRRASAQVTFLAFAAGIMLGAAFFHMLPEALHTGGYRALSFVPAGFALLFVLERYVLVHVCEEPPDCEEHAHLGATLGLTAFLGLSAHTLFDGIALASATQEGVGLTAFIAIAAHKAPSSLSLASLLKAEGRGPRAILAYALAYGLMVPLGAGLYLALGSLTPLEHVAPKALAFSAGTFLYIAVSDLLPHINRHGKQGRLAHVGGLCTGLGVMFALSYAVA
jgi:zinc and cadmium transporter